jgi:hypothetical protein
LANPIFNIFYAHLNAENTLKLSLTKGVRQQYHFDDQLDKMGDDMMKRCKHHSVGTPRIPLRS